MKERGHQEYGADSVDVDAVGLTPGKHSLTDQIGKSDRVISSEVGRSMRTDGIAVQRKANDRGVQRKTSSSPIAGDAVTATAAAGVAGAGGTLPHLGAIQSAFGHHEVGEVRAHVGGAAADAATAIGARAYATGNDVAFGSSPDLHTAAHEAAHVVQQRGGVRLAGGVGQAGDAYEQHADAVADLVVGGKSAEPLLDTMAHRGASGGSAVQKEDAPGAAGAAAASGAGAVAGGASAAAAPSASTVAASHVFAVPPVTDLSRIPDAVNRNQAINQGYHTIDAAMTGYLGDPLVSNWFTYGQHASHEAGLQIRNLQAGLLALNNALTTLRGLTFLGTPGTVIVNARLAVQTIQIILELANADGLVGQCTQLALTKAGITTSELTTLTTEASVALAAPAGMIFPPAALALVLPFIGHLASVVARVIVAIPAIITAVNLIYDNMKTGNRQIYENVAPAAAAFLSAALAAPNGVPGGVAFVGDTSGFLAAAFAEYGEVRQLGDDARLTPGTPDATTKLATRQAKANHANLLIGFQEQLVILQPLFNTMTEELNAMGGTMVLHDPNGAHPLANNWADFYSRMGIDPRTAPKDPSTITPSTLPPLLPPSDRQGTISSYFGDNLTDERVHEAPEDIAPIQPDAPNGVSGDVRGAAAEGVSGAAGPLPHLDQIQRSFGAHDVSHVQAHTDQAAASGASAMGANAFAMGDHVAFGAQPDLHLAAHEAAHVVQQQGGVQLSGGVGQAGDTYERHADAVADTVVRGESAEGLLGAPKSGGSAAVQRKVTPIPSARLAKPVVLGDGTAANPGMAIDALEAYVTRQADWFTDPSFTAADRESTWKVVNLFGFGGHVSQALAKLHTGEVAALPDRAILMKYVSCFDSSAETVQLTTVAPSLARALKLGQAIKDLEGFVPTAVLRHVIPESGLVYLVDLGKVAELKKYYTLFQPTLEKPEEWPHIEQLLTETIALWAPLVGWVSELHIFTLLTRAMLLGNINDKSRSRPVLLTLMSAVDWNTAFLQAKNLEAVMVNNKNLALIVQGRTLAAVTAQVTRVANDYGKGKKLGQVVFAGHGSDTSMEMASDSTQGWWDAPNDRVAYDGQGDIDSSTKKDKDPKKSSDPKSNGTELLIDTVLASMDPATANIVFAGCLINSHDIDPKLNLTGNAATIQKKLQANIAAHPNLADYVRARMKATGHAATLGASNSSTTFDSFNLDATGKAQLSNPGDPDVAGTKIQYVKTGIEAEGALRAAIECCADPALGIVKTTVEMRARVAALAGTADWGLIVTRLGFELSLPAAGGASVAAMVDVVHRIRVWVDYNPTVNAQSLADSVKKSEATRVFTALLVASSPDVAAGIHHAWTKYDPSHAANMMVSLTTSGLTSEAFAKMLSRPILDKHLTSLLPIGAPTKAQMILALTIADQDGAAMPKSVRDFLRAAAGGATTTTFPAGLNVDTILPNGTPKILEAIGLSPKSPPAAGATIDGNVDADHDGMNETHIATDPHRAEVVVPGLVVRDTPTSSGKSLGTIAKPLIVRVMGTTRAGAWSLIDFNGATGFVATKYLSR